MSGMNQVTDRLRERVRELLADGKIHTFIGYERAWDPYRPIPFFATEAGEAERLIIDELCVPSTPKYMLDFFGREGVVGLLVKGCDSLAVERLLRDHRVERESMYIIGVACTGLLDRDKVKARALEEGWGAVEEVRREGDAFVLVTAAGEKELGPEYLMERCRTCEVKVPTVYDELLGEEVAATAEPRDFAEVAEIEAMTPAERRAYWERQFSRCIRCFACRNVCPACNCRICVFEERVPRWLGRKTDVGEQEMFHFTRALHVAGRCVDCGECDRVCPVNIPLRKLNRKLMKDIGELFGIEKPFMPAETEPLGQFRPDDPDEFE